MAASRLTIWMLAACASTAWGYQPLVNVGPRLMMHSTSLRPYPIMRIDQHEDAEELDDEELARLAEEAGAAARSPDTVAAVRAAAEKQVELLRAEMESGGFAAPSATHKDGLYKSLNKPKGSIALIGEGSPQQSVSLGGYDLNDPIYLSSQFRSSGCAAVCVTVGGERELCPTAIADTAKEQSYAKGEFPGPLPILVRQDVVDEVQLARSAADGAGAAMISMLLNGADATKQLMESASSFGLEAVVRVGDKPELESALDLGAKIVCLGDMSLRQAEALLPLIPKDVRTICDTRVRDVRGAWKVRDMGFNGLIVSDAVLEVCARDRVPPEAVIKAMLAKGSVKFGLGMQKGRLEGAKESLGSIAM